MVARTKMKCHGYKLAVFLMPPLDYRMRRKAHAFRQGDIRRMGIYCIILLHMV
jgi:hypothetical protein